MGVSGCVCGGVQVCVGAGVTLDGVEEFDGQAGWHCRAAQSCIGQRIPYQKVLGAAWSLKMLVAAG